MSLRQTKRLRDRPATSPEQPERAATMSSGIVRRQWHASAMPARVRVFIASSIDGFIAGPNDELDWLDSRPGAGAVEDTFTPFMAEIGALLMGRRTYDIVTGLAAPWPYGDTPVLVATQRALTPVRDTVRAVSGDIGEVVATAKRTAGARDVYIDGGGLIRSALDAGLVDELNLTIIPCILGAGIPLFAGTQRRHDVELVSQRSIGGGMVHLVYQNSDS